jgi:hypothetical protein
MLPEYQARKRRYQDDIIRRIESDSGSYLHLDSPSERRGRPARTKPQPRSLVRFGRFAPPPEPSETQRAFNAGLYDGFTFNAGDEISAALEAVPAWFDERDAGQVYDDELARVRAESAYLQEQHPYAYGGGVVVGSLVQPATYAPIGWVGRGAALASRAGQASKLTAKAINLAKAGAIDGGISGFNSGTGGLENRLVQAGKGAAVGATIGGALPVAGAATARGAQIIAKQAKRAAHELEIAAAAAAAAVARHPAELPALHALARKILDNGGGDIDLPQRLRNSFDLLARRDGSAIANEIAIVRSARGGQKSNFGLGSADEATSKRLAEAFLEPGYWRSKGGYAMLSADRLRQYRLPRHKDSQYATTGTQSNFESRWVPEGEWQSNGHLNIGRRKWW